MRSTLNDGLVRPRGFDLVVMVASLGGLTVMRSIVRRLPADFPAPVVAVLHAGPQSPKLTASILSRDALLSVGYAEDGQPLRAGHITVAPPDLHLRLDRGGRCRLDQGRKVSYSRPSADVVLASCAQSFGSRTLAVVLTGRLSDGARGAKAVRAAGGVVIAQEPSSCRAPGMPDATIAADAATFVLPSTAIADALLGLVAVRGLREALGLRVPPAA